MKKSILLSFIIFTASFSLTYIYALNSHNAIPASYTFSNTQITQEEARELLIKYNNKVDYIYKSSSKKVKSLTDKNLEGYIFAPSKPVDFKYFVDKHTSDIYILYTNGKIEHIEY